MSELITTRAPAKINLALSVGSPEEDGMHPIASWMMTVNLYDELELKKLLPQSQSRFATIWHDEATRKADIDWPFQKDLSARAHHALEERVGRKLLIQSTLRKRIPLGGGVGGGSSDAAMMLIGLNHLFDLGLERSELADIGREVGSDIPFLVHGGSAIVEGRGEQVENLADPPEIHAVLAFPDLGCPTAEVYHRFDELETGRSVDPERVRNVAKNPSFDAPFNDLAAPAFDLFPALKKISEDLESLAERPAHLSGSGSTIFVLCDDPLHAEQLALVASERLDLPCLSVSGAEGVEMTG